MKHLLAVVLVFFITNSVIAQESNIQNKIIEDTIPLHTLKLSERNAIENELKLTKENNKNSLKIVSITPINDLKHNETYTFTVAVVYNLITNEKGILNIGYNNDANPDSYKLIKEISKKIDQGSGYHIFKVTAKVFDLSSKGHAFFISTNLSEYPHDKVWSPLASNRFLLKVN